MKKIVALTLCFLLVLPLAVTCLSFGVFAEGGEVIKETTSGYSDSIGYGGHIVRTKSDGSIIMSPFLSQFSALLSKGEKIESYTAEIQYTLLSGKGGDAKHTFDKFTASINKSNGTYFDIYLNGTKGNTGFCPIAGEFYDVEINIYKNYGKDNAEKVLYGTYKNAEIPTDIKSSKYYKPTAAPGNASDYNITLSYSFNNTLKGSAAGDIVVTVDKPGNFLICWGDKNGSPLKVTTGEKTLNYSPLAEFSLTGAKGGEYSYKVIGFTAIPVGAVNLLVTDSTKNVLKSIKIPEDKLLDEKEPEYTFGIVSDVHYNYFFNSSKTVDYAIEAFDVALAFYKAAGAKLVSAVGDYSIYGEEKSYKQFSEAVEKSGMTVIACGGNHELYAKLDVMFGQNGIWRKYMNKGVYDGSLEGVLDIADNGIDFTYQIPGVDNAVFVSLSQWYWDGHAPSQQHLVEPSQLVWLENQLETHKNKTVYLMFHTYLSDDDHENIDGQGDITSKGGYSYGGHYNFYTEDEGQFRAILTKYDNVIWFNGHSHYEYSMQMHNENVNIFDYQGTTATMVHVPSVTNPRTVAVNGTNYSSLCGDASQGALQFVYDGYQIMNGVDLWGEEIFSYACYIIYTDKEGVVDEGVSADGKITWTFDRQHNSLRILGEGAIDKAVFTKAPYDVYKNEIKSIYIGEGITSIVDGAFEGFSALCEVEIKEGVTVIGSNAFKGTSVSTLVLPSTLTEVGEGAFGGIEKINDIVYGGTEEKWTIIKIGENNPALMGEISFKSVKISFVWDDTTWVVDVNVGDIPIFDIVPEKEHEDENKCYVFEGWKIGSKTYNSKQQLPKAKRNTVYTAVFKEIDERYVNGDVSGTRIKWTYDRKTCTLTIDGMGIIPDFSDSKNQPWAKYASEIRTVVVKKGITTIGKNSFSRLTALTKAVIPDGVIRLQMDAFAYDTLLTDVYFPASLKSVGQGALYNADNVKTIYYGGTVEQWQKLCEAAEKSMYNENVTMSKDVVMEGKDRECQHVKSKMLGYDSEGHWFRCNVCGEIFGNAAHTYGDWRVSKQPTVAEEGLEIRECECGTREEKTIPMLTPEPTPEETMSAIPTPTPTGEIQEEFPTVLIVVLSASIVIVAGVIITLAVVKKKKK